ncbi:hypothetical protein CTAYLR_007618 [Chrysophaeum taylorii]|uniref:SH2 domain-containing protein n=1 Tax=Chrysophaeum taylorii TaxID=2483200 RepID=A0AAD7XF80_9STRA|nr:hypothetical protein CTAYLR_007618 [Chrysophaeum taylorii]
MASLFDDEAVESSDEEKEDDDDEEEDEENEYEKDDFVVSDDEVEEVEATTKKKKKKKQFSRLRKKRREEVPDEEDLALVRESQHDPKRQKSFGFGGEETKVTDDYFDDDNFDDFIEDDLGEQQARQAREARRRLPEGVSQLAMQDMLEIFGEYDEPLRPVKTEKARFEPSSIAEHFQLPEDEKIRRRDVPERLQLRTSRDADKFEAGLSAEIEFIKEKVEFEASDEEIERVLRFVALEHLEPTFIRYYRRDYVALDEERLWRIFELDEQFAVIQRRFEIPCEDDAVRAAVDATPFDDNASKDAMRFVASTRSGGGATSSKRKSSSSSTKELMRIPKKKTLELLAARKKPFDPKRVEAYGATWTLAPAAVDEALRRSDASLPKNKEIPTPQEAPEYHAMNFESEDAEAFHEAAKAMAAEKLSFAPTLRRHVRADLRAIACVSTRPTERGREEIDMSHECHGLQHVRCKAASDFFASDASAEMFGKLLRAEREGLIEIGIAAADKREDAEVFGEENELKYDLGALAAPILEVYTSEKKEEEDEWNAERTWVAKTSIGALVLPQLEEELRKDLERRAHEAIARLAGRELRRRIDVSPGDHQPRALGIHAGRSASDSSWLVAVSEVGVATGSMSTAGNASSRDKLAVDNVADFLLKHRPERILLGTSAGLAACRRCWYLIEKAVTVAREKGRRVLQAVDQQLVDDRDAALVAAFGGYCDHDELGAWVPKLSYAEDSLARAFSLSSRASREYETEPPAFRAAVSLAREAQNAVAEFSYCWLASGAASFSSSSGSSTLVLGYDCLSLKLHALVDDVKPQMLLREYEKHLVEVVAKTGVDLELATTYDHYFGQLQFVPGLGPRKATFVRLNAQSAYRATNRSVLSRELLATLLPLPPDMAEDPTRSKCFLNAAAFVRFPAKNTSVVDAEERNPLDDTRIHPECYFNKGGEMHDWAQKMCSDALEREIKRGHYFGIVEDAMAYSRRRVEEVTASSRNPSGIAPKFGTFLVGDRKLEDHPDTRADNAIADQLAELDLDAYAALLEHEYHLGKRREQLEDVKRELRWPFREMRARVWDAPDDMTVFEWFAAAPFPSSLDARARVIRGVASPDFVPKLRPRQIVTARVRGADAGRLYCELSGEVAGGIRGAVDKTKIIESDDMRDAVGGDVDHVEEHRETRVKNRDAARLDDGDVFDACVLAVEPDRLRVTLSRLDLDVFFPDSVDAYMSHPATATEILDPAFDRRRAAADYVLLATKRKDSALRARKLRLAGGGGGDNKQASYVLLPDIIQRRRPIAHPRYMKDVKTYERAEAKLAEMDEGDAIVRHSRSKPNLVLSWAFRPNVYKHVVITDVDDGANDDNDGKPRYDTAGRPIPRKKAKTAFRVDDETFVDVDELLAHYVEPMNAYVRDFVDHPKFASDVQDAEALDAFLARAKRAQSSSSSKAPVYCFWVNKKYPGYVALSVLLGSTPKHAYISVAPNGLNFCDRRFKSVPEVEGYFKRHPDRVLASSSRRSASAASSKRSAERTSSSRPASSVTKSRPSSSSSRNDAPRSSSSKTPRAPAAAPSRRHHPEQQHQHQQQQQQPMKVDPPAVQQGGPVGRGRGRTMPAWMTKEQQ